MIDVQHLRAWWSRAHLAVLLPAAVIAALVSSAVDRSAGHPILAALARSTAVVLLVGVSWACVQLALRWRAVVRHDSIRADIAAAGGLGRRLMI